MPFPIPRINRPTGQPQRGNRFRREPEPGAATPEEQVTVYEGSYGQMPMPATQFATSTAKLQSLNTPPSVRNAFANASFVDRRDRRKGIIYTSGRQSYVDRTPESPNPVFSSDFQKWLIGPHPNFVIYKGIFAAGYPAATISYGTMRNLALSERAPQIATNYSGGPGPGGTVMETAPRFNAVQSVPRYSTMPPQYRTTSPPT